MQGTDSAQLTTTVMQFGAGLLSQFIKLYARQQQVKIDP
jgi:hypothetical protein